jgi:hypothetical protein
VGYLSTPATSAPPTSIPIEILQENGHVPSRAMLSSAADDVSPGLQGLRLPSRAEVMLLQQAADAGMIILLQDDQGSVEAVDADGWSPLVPRKR